MEVFLMVDYVEFKGWLLGKFRVLQKGGSVFEKWREGGLLGFLFFQISGACRGMREACCGMSANYGSAPGWHAAA